MKFHLGPQDIIGIVKRRFFWAVIPFLMLFLVGLVVVGLLPPMFESRATLMVEDQQIRNEYVESAVSSDALQRVESVSARVMARDSLLLLANELNLFQGQGLTISERARRMRERAAIRVNRIQSNSNRRGDPSFITVQISYRSKLPAQAQQVTNRLMTEFMTRSVEIRSEIAGEQTEFLREEENKLSRALTSTINRISEIKLDNPDTLPENRALYERTLERSISELSRINSAIEQTEQDIRLLELQRPVIMNSDNTTRAEQELRDKRRILDALLREYTDSYPDVISMKQEVMALEKDLDPPAFRKRARDEITSLNSQIGSATEGSEQYKELVQRRDNIQSQLENAPRGSQPTSISQIQYDSQRLVYDTRIETLEKQREKVAQRITDYEERLEDMPAVESQLYRLTEEKELLEQELRQLRQSRSSAERSESLEQQSKAERLSVLEQPNRPEKPIAPNKPQMAVLAFGFAGLLAGLIALVPELLFAKVRGRHHLKELIADLKVVEVPRYNINESRKRRWLLIGAQLGVCGILALCVAYVGYKTLL